MPVSFLRVYFALILQLYFDDPKLFLFCLTVAVRWLYSSFHYCCEETSWVF